MSLKTVLTSIPRAQTSQGISMSGIITIVVVLLVLGVLLWGWNRIVGVLPIAEPFKTIAYVIVVCAIAIWVIYQLAGLATGVHLPSLR